MNKRIYITTEEIYNAIALYNQNLFEIECQNYLHNGIKTLRYLVYDKGDKELVADMVLCVNYSNPKKDR